MPEHPVEHARLREARQDRRIELRDEDDARSEFLQIDCS